MPEPKFLMDLDSVSNMAAASSKHYLDMGYLLDLSAVASPTQTISLEQHFEDGSRKVVSLSPTDNQCVGTALTLPPGK